MRRHGEHAAPASRAEMPGGRGGDGGNRTVSDDANAKIEAEKSADAETIINDTKKHRPRGMIEGSDAPFDQQGEEAVLPGKRLPPSCILCRNRGGG